MLSIKRYFQKFIISFVSITLLSSCSQINGITNKNIATPANVAILLPSSEIDTKISAEYSKMVKMGLADGAKTQIKVTTYNYADQEQLLESLSKIFDQGTDVIIGPISSEDTDIVSSKTRNNGVIVLSMSNNPVLASKGTFVCGHAPMRQLEQIMNYLLDNDYKNYIALLPSGKYSNTVSAILQDMISNKDASLSRIKFYNDSKEDIEKSVRVVSDAVNHLNENDFNLKQPVVLIADDNEALQILYKDFKKYNLDKKAIIAGDSRIDIDSSFPVDITFTGSLNMANGDMILRSVNLNVNHVSFMHAIAYDLGKITAEYIGNGYNIRKFLNRMNSGELSSGMSGEISFTDSIAKRKYAILKKEKGGYVEQSSNQVSVAPDQLHH